MRSRFLPPTRPPACAATASPGASAGQAGPLARLVRATLLGLCALSAVPGLPSTARAQQAQAAARAYDIPPGPLSRVLNQFAGEAGIQVSVAAALTDGLASPGLRGSHTVASGFQALLQGTGLAAVDRGASEYTLQRLPAGADAVMLGAVAVVGQAERTATTEGTGSYAPGIVTLGPLPGTLRDIPQSVTVVTRQQIEDRNFATLDDVLETVPGLTGSTANFGSTTYYARGQEISKILIDGMPVVNGLAGLSQNMAMFDRVEVQRGAAGVISGASGPGGVINLHRKRPTAEPQLLATTRVGSWDNYYAELDAGGPLNDSASVRGRLVAAYEDRGYFVDLQKSRKPLLYGIAEMDVTDDTLLTLGGSYQKADFDGLYLGGLPRYSDGGDLGLPRSSRGMSPGWNTINTRNSEIFAAVEHDFAPDWKVTLKGNWQSRRQESPATNSFSGAVDRETLLGPRYAGDNYSLNKNRQKAFDLMVNGAFSAFGQRHELVVGANWNETRSDGQVRVLIPGRQGSGDIFDYDPWELPRPSFPVKPPVPSERKAGESSAYGMLRLRVADPLTLVGGLRVGNWKDETLTYATGQVNRVEEKHVVTPSLGAIYRLSQAWSAYASYADSFRVQSDRYSADGSPLEPVVGANYEVGVKGELYGGRLNAAAALFRIDETNRAQLDPANEAPCAGSPTGGDCYVASGKVRSQGLDLELTGELQPGWQIAAGYTFQTSKYLRDFAADGSPSSNQGRAFSTISPKHLLRVWTQYQLRDDWNRWSLGGGVTVQSANYQRSGDLRIEQGGYAIWSARIGYRLDAHWDASLLVNNLFDKKYYQRVGTLAGGNRYGEPLAVALTLRGRF